MRCAAALSTAAETAAIDEISAGLRQRLAGDVADLIVMFSSPDHADNLGLAARRLVESGIGRHVLGCTGESIVGEDRELEQGPALAAWALARPGLSVRPVRLDEPGEVWQGPAAAPDASDRRLLLLLGDPYSFRIDEFLKEANKASPGLPIVGGMASGSQVPRGNVLVLDRQTYHSGAVAVELGGTLRVQTVVSQGCRPIGRTMVVTRADGNVIHEVGRRPCLEVLQETYQGLTPEDQKRLREGLHLGRVISEYRESFCRGDFLVRNVIGADDSGAVHINDLVRVGQTVQFHVRDAETADEDLRETLRRAASNRLGESPPAGALLFTCNGRGTRLFEAPDHDVALIRETFGPIPAAGFFAMGEIGPIGGQNFLHGFTASVVLFEAGD